MIVNKYAKPRSATVHYIKASIRGLIHGKSTNKTYSQKFFAKYKNIDDVPIFESIQIETINKCNGICSFCPVNKNVDTRKTKKMTDELFLKIITGLADINYKGKIALFSNNEPFIDAKIEERAKIAKSKCPNAYIYIYTNGTLLTLERFFKIEPWVDKIIIDNYNDELKINDNLYGIVEACKNSKILDEKVEIHLRKENEVLFTRGGLAPNNSKRIEREDPCFLPFNQMVIRPDGLVSLCCNDALGKETLGDVNISSLEEIWYSENYKKIRELAYTNIASIDLCKYCDSMHKS